MSLVSLQVLIEQALARGDSPNRIAEQLKTTVQRVDQVALDMERVNSEPEPKEVRHMTPRQGVALAESWVIQDAIDQALARHPAGKALCEWPDCDEPAERNYMCIPHDEQAWADDETESLGKQDRDRQVWDE